MCVFTRLLMCALMLVFMCVLTGVFMHVFTVVVVQTIKNRPFKFKHGNVTICQQQQM